MNDLSVLFPYSGIEGWLFPALFKYFDSAPPAFYAKAEPKNV
jgi:hypothetical protein